MCFGVEHGRGCGVMLAHVGLLGRRGRAICRWRDGSSIRLCVKKNYVLNNSQTVLGRVWFGLPEKNFIKFF